MNQPDGSEFSGLRLARSEAHQLLQVLQEWRKLGERQR
jgi:hypothetical protein